MASQNNWYALQVRTNFEVAAANLLMNQGFEVYLPQYKTRRQWSDRVKELERALFPGYLFCRLNVAARLPVLMTPGVINIVSVGKSPAAIDDEQITALMTAMKCGKRVEPWPFLAKGDRVLIHSGALKGLEGILIDAKGKHRLVLSVPLLQRSVAIELDAFSVRPLTRSAMLPAAAPAAY